MLDRIGHVFYLTFIYGDRWVFFLEGLRTTIILTFAAFIAGTVVGLALCALKLSKKPAVVKCVNIITGFFIKLPTLVMLMIMLYIIFADVHIATLIVIIIGLTFKTASYLSVVFHAAISALDSGEGEAARTVGMTKWQAFRYVTFPQAMKLVMPVYKNQFVVTLQETSIVGYLAVMDLTRAAEIIMSRTLDAFFGLITISIMYIVLGVVFSSVIGLLYREKHIGGTADDRG